MEENAKRVDIGHVQKHAALKGAAWNYDPQLVDRDKKALPLSHMHVEEMRI